MTSKPERGGFLRRYVLGPRPETVEAYLVAQRGWVTSFQLREAFGPHIYSTLRRMDLDRREEGAPRERGGRPRVYYRARQLPGAGG